MNLLTTVARTWLTRTFAPYRFSAENDVRLRYDVCPGLVLYVHIPFCRSICNFYSYCKDRYTPEAASAYTAALLQEIHMVGQMQSGRTRVGSLYFGGGTPALLAAALAAVPFETGSMDFIFALPGQKLEHIRHDLDTAFSHGANHVAVTRRQRILLASI